MARTLPRPVATPDPLALDLAALGALVRNRRAQIQMRIDDAADMLGVSKDVLSRLENGRAVGLDKLFKILDGLGLPRSTLNSAGISLHALTSRCGSRRAQGRTDR
ncbi:helix-turn-helix domain-containing protein [Burkholderia anthina]|uniref:helix-turn-helix domain-containing protein n=1 Tax=Burkholderia anthina TaxID=179879 RepID=UPI0009BD7908|nr:helix-turn-helix transcriptional regulator [Burkholderia anthina]